MDPSPLAAAANPAANPAPVAAGAALAASVLLLADSRLPAGGHAHSGGLEPAAAAGAVTDLAGLADFLRGRLATAGLVAAALAAAACAHAAGPATGQVAGTGAGPDAGWLLLDAEADARTPSPAQRAASRAQGRALLRIARTTWPHPALDTLHDVHIGHIGHIGSAGAARRFTAGRDGRGPHQPIVLGAATAAADGAPAQAATIAAYGSVTGPAAAAVRLLGLDPLAVHRVLAGLAADVDAIAAQAAAAAFAAGGEGGEGGWARLPAPSAPALDVYAERHLRSEMRLFES